MPSLPAELTAAVAAGDRSRILSCLTAHVYGGALDPMATPVLLALAKGHDAHVTGAFLCALFHAGGPVATGAVVALARPHEGDARVVQAAMRLLAALDAPDRCEAAARWVRRHPVDETVSYYAARLLLGAPRPGSRHDALGWDLATVAAATACRADGVLVEGVPWHTWVLAWRFPRLRP